MPKQPYPKQNPKKKPVNRAAPDQFPEGNRQGSKVHVRENYHFKEGELTPDSKKHYLEDKFKQSNISDFFSSFVGESPSSTQSSSEGIIPGLLETGGHLLAGNYLGAGISGGKLAKKFFDEFGGTTQERKEAGALEASQESSEFDIGDTPPGNTQGIDTIFDQDILSPGLPDSEGMEANTPMDTVSSQEVAQPGAMAGGASRSGAGPGMGNMGIGGINAPSIYSGNIPSGTPWKTTFQQSYNFLLPACKSRVFYARNTGGTDQNARSHTTTQTFFLKIGSSAYVPMHMIWMYMDPSQYHSIYNRHNKFHIHKVGAKIHAFGIRAPYTTGQSNIEVANANLQATLQDITPIAYHYPTGTGGPSRPDAVQTESITAANNSLFDLYQKVRGEAFASDGHTPGIIFDSHEFNNVSARFETRRWPCRAWLGLNEPGTHRIEAANNVHYWPDGYHHSWPNINYFIEKTVNGSNHLGLMFQKMHNVEKTIWTRTTPAHFWPDNQNGGQSGEQATVQDGSLATGTSYSKINSGIQQFQQHGSPNTTATLATQSGQAFYDIALENWKFPGDQMGIPSMFLATIHGAKEVSEMGEDKQFPFVFCMKNIRNITTDVATDISVGSPENDIVDLNFEFVLEMAMEASGYCDLPIYWNPTLHPTPDWFKKKQIWRNTNAAQMLTSSLYMPVNKRGYAATVQLQRTGTDAIQNSII